MASAFLHFCQAVPRFVRVPICYNFWFPIFCPPAVSFFSDTSGSAGPRTQKYWPRVAHSCRWPWGSTSRHQECPNFLTLELKYNKILLRFWAYCLYCSRLASSCSIFYFSRSLSFLPPFLSYFFLLLMIGHLVNIIINM